MDGTKLILIAGAIGIIIFLCFEWKKWEPFGLHGVPGLDWNNFLTAPKTGDVFRLICVDGYEIEWQHDVYWDMFGESFVLFPSGHTSPAVTDGQILFWEPL